MAWIVWLLLCLGPGALAYYKGIAPYRILAMSFGGSIIAYIVGWGFMSMTGASSGVATATGQILALAAIGAVFFMTHQTDSADNPERIQFRRKKDRLCPNCAAFLEPHQVMCPSCGESIEV